MRIVEATNCAEFESTCEDIENFLKEKYISGATPKNNKSEEEFRVYKESNKRVSNFYKENHKNQTLDFVLQKKKKYEALDKMEMGIWEGLKI
jgi:inositol oxygenase